MKVDVWPLEKVIYVARMRRASPTCCRVFYLAPLYSPYICFSFDFDHLKLNYSKSSGFYFILQN
jgi:hypothetical protein